MVATYRKAMPTRLLFTALLFAVVLSYKQACNQQDQSSLLAFSANISTLSSPPLNWSSSVSCCEWEGVDCDTNGRVTHLQLPSRGLKGLLTSSIGNLFSLTHLNLSNNYLHGTFLGENIVGLINLKVIDLSSNSFHGSIPREIGKLSYLEKLHLDENKLYGPIPSSLMNCSNLEEIILRDNLLNGDISKLDFSRLVHLQKLDLAINTLKGTIPESVYSCKSLIAFRVAANNITGQISPRIVGLKSLSFLSLTHNSFMNITTTLRVLAKCKNLTALFLSNNFYGEPLPIHRNFIGSNEFSKLQYLSLSSCGFGGPIPNWLANLKRLRNLCLSSNKMTGKVPDWFGTLPNLSILKLSNNSLSGEFPLQLCQLPSLMSQNPNASLDKFHFELPVFMLNYGTFRTWSSGVYTGQALRLSNNRFNGDIPPQIGNLLSLQVLDLSSNNFTGHIPMGISNLKILETLDLSENSMTGEIPKSLASLHFLSSFNVSYNDFGGQIPVGGQFDTFDESSFEGNPHLCGEQLNHPCAIDESSNAQYINVTEDGYMLRMQLFVNGLIVGCAFGFSSVLSIVASYVCLNNLRDKIKHS